MTRTHLGALVLAVFSAIIAGGILVPSPVHAHAAVASSSPAANEVLDTAPNLVEITFTERVVPGVSVIQVLNSNGARVDRGDSRRLDFEPTTVVVSLEPGLAEGVYTIAWRNISDVDGHPLSGSFVFFVGEASFEAPIEVEQPPLFASPLEPVLRWVVLIGGILFAGTPLAYLLVLAPVMERDEHRRIRGRIESIALLAGVTMLAGSAAQLLLQTSVTGLGLSAIVLDTSWGQAWWIRSLLTALVAMSYVAIRQELSPRWQPRLRAGAVVLGLCAIAAVSLSSHAAATQYVEFAAILVDLTHTIAAAVWGGGLVAFLLVVAMTARSSDRESGRVLRAAMPRFSVLGLLATFTLFVTGAYSSWLQMVTAEALSTPYGTGVVVKVVVLIALIGLGAVNLIWVRRQLSETGTASRGTSWLRRIMRIEVAGILIAVVAAGSIASMEPGKQTVTRTQGAEVSDTGTDGDLDIALAVRPGSLGMNEVTATLTRRGDAYGNATSVIARLTFVDAELGEVELPLEDRGDGVWGVRDVPLSIAGQYQLSTLVQRTDGFDARHVFRFQTAGAATSLEVAPATAWRIGVIVLVVVGVAMIAANYLASRRRIIRSEGLGWAGAGLCALAVFMVARVPEPAVSLTNPILPEPASIQAGQTLFQTHCVVCHGETGVGDGPASPTTPFPVADLTYHVPLHTDAELYRSISAGRPTRGMPEYEDTLSETEIWHLVNYIRDLARAAAVTEGTPPAVADD